MLTLTCNVGSFQKPAELKEESRHDGEQKGEHMNHVQKRSQIMFLKQGREEKKPASKQPKDLQGDNNNNKRNVDQTSVFFYQQQLKS